MGKNEHLPLPQTKHKNYLKVDHRYKDKSQTIKLLKRNQRKSMRSWSKQKSTLTSEFTERHS